MATSEVKQAVRDAVRQQRRRRLAMSAEQRATEHGRLTEHLSRLVVDRGARSVSCYLPTASEPDTSGFLHWAAAQGITVLLPVPSETGRLHWVRSHGERTAPGAHGIREPLGDRMPSSAVGAVDLMLIPACAVDHHGMRLGWGLGYFDRCLAALDPAPPVFAIIYEDEVLAKVPSDPHDVPVTGWVTPGGAALPDAAE